MSKQSEAKRIQGYTPKFEAGVCQNCEHFTSEFEEFTAWDKSTWTKEKNLRCCVGGFAVKKRGSCECHSRKNQSEQ